MVRKLLGKQSGVTPLQVRVLSLPLMKYLVQVFVGDDSVGSWHNTALGGDDKDHAFEVAEKIAQSNRQRVSKVRVVEVLKELDCYGLVR